jgi:hypothetical protein
METLNRNVLKGEWHKLVLDLGASHALLGALSYYDLLLLQRILVLHQDDNDARRCLESVNAEKRDRPANIVRAYFPVADHSTGDIRYMDVLLEPNGSGFLGSVVSIWATPYSLPGGKIWRDAADAAVAQAFALLDRRGIGLDIKRPRVTFHVDGLETLEFDVSESHGLALAIAVVEAALRLYGRLSPDVPSPLQPFAFTGSPGGRVGWKTPSCLVKKSAACLKAQRWLVAVAPKDPQAEIVPVGDLEEAVDLVFGELLTSRFRARYREGLKDVLGKSLGDCPTLRLASAEGEQLAPSEIAARVLDNGESCAIVGPAGSGKSWILHQVVLESLKRNGTCVPLIIQGSRAESILDSAEEPSSDPRWARTRLVAAALDATIRALKPVGDDAPAPLEDWKRDWLADGLAGGPELLLAIDDIDDERGRNRVERLLHRLSGRLHESCRVVLAYRHLARAPASEAASADSPSFVAFLERATEYTRGYLSAAEAASVCGWYKLETEQVPSALRPRATPKVIRLLKDHPHLPSIEDLEPIALEYHLQDAWRTRVLGSSDALSDDLSRLAYADRVGRSPAELGFRVPDGGWKRLTDFGEVGGKRHGWLWADASLVEHETTRFVIWLTRGFLNRPHKPPLEEPDLLRAMACPAVLGFLPVVAAVLWTVPEFRDWLKTLLGRGAKESRSVDVAVGAALLAGVPWVGLATIVNESWLLPREHTVDCAAYGATAMAMESSSMDTWHFREWLERNDSRRTAQEALSVGAWRLMLLAGQIPGSDGYELIYNAVMKRITSRQVWEEPGWHDFLGHVGSSAATWAALIEWEERQTEKVEDREMCNLARMKLAAASGRPLWEVGLPGDHAVIGGPLHADPAILLPRSAAVRVPSEWWRRINEFFMQQVKADLDCGRPVPLLPVANLLNLRMNGYELDFVPVPFPADRVLLPTAGSIPPSQAALWLLCAASLPDEGRADAVESVQAEYPCCAVAALHFQCRGTPAQNEAKQALDSLLAKWGPAYDDSSIGDLHRAFSAMFACQFAAEFPKPWSDLLQREGLSGSPTPGQHEILAAWLQWTADDQSARYEMSNGSDVVRDWTRVSGGSFVASEAVAGALARCGFRHGAELIRQLRISRGEGDGWATVSHRWLHYARNWPRLKHWMSVCERAREEEKRAAASSSATRPYPNLRPAEPFEGRCPPDVGVLSTNLGKDESSARGGFGSPSTRGMEPLKAFRTTFQEATKAWRRTKKAVGAAPESGPERTADLTMAFVADHGVQLGKAFLDVLCAGDLRGLTEVDWRTLGRIPWYPLEPPADLQRMFDPAWVVNRCRDVTASSTSIDGATQIRVADLVLAQLTDPLVRRHVFMALAVHAGVFTMVLEKCEPNLLVAYAPEFLDFSLRTPETTDLMEKRLRQVAAENGVDPDAVRKAVDTELPQCIDGCRERSYGALVEALRAIELHKLFRVVKLNEYGVWDVA